MAYIYEVSFDIDADQMSSLKIGASLERVLGYLKSLLPSEQGYITARTFFTVESEETTRVAFVSEWLEWEDLKSHQESALLEDKVIEEFGPVNGYKNLAKRIYSEIS